MIFEDFGSRMKEVSLTRMYCHVSHCDDAKLTSCPSMNLPNRSSLAVYLYIA